MIVQAQILAVNALMDINLFRMRVVPAIRSTIWLQVMYAHPASLPSLIVWTAVTALLARFASMDSQPQAIVLAAIQDIICMEEYVTYVLLGYLTVILAIAMLLFAYLV